MGGEGGENGDGEGEGEIRKKKEEIRNLRGVLVWSEKFEVRSVGCASRFLWVLWMGIGGGDLFYFLLFNFYILSFTWKAQFLRFPVQGVQYV